MNKRLIITHVIALAVGAALSYGKAQTTISNKQEVKQDNSIVTEVRTQKPDGSTVTRTRIRKDVSQETGTVVRTDLKQGIGINSSADKVRVGIIASTRLVGVPGLTYGAMVQKKLLGPLSIGVFGLTDATFGVILALDL